MHVNTQNNFKVAPSSSSLGVPWCLEFALTPCTEARVISLFANPHSGYMFSSVLAVSTFGHVRKREVNLDAVRGVPGEHTLSQATPEQLPSAVGVYAARPCRCSSDVQHPWSPPRAKDGKHLPSRRRRLRQAMLPGNTHPSHSDRPPPPSSLPVPALGAWVTGLTWESAECEATRAGPSGPTLA